jgi:hypothetical protein
MHAAAPAARRSSRSTLLQRSSLVPPRSALRSWHRRLLRRPRQGTPGNCRGRQGSWRGNCGTRRRPLQRLGWRRAWWVVMPPAPAPSRPTAVDVACAASAGPRPVGVACLPRTASMCLNLTPTHPLHRSTPIGWLQRHAAAAACYEARHVIAAARLAIDPLVGFRREGQKRGSGAANLAGRGAVCIRERPHAWEKGTHAR